MKLNTKHNSIYVKIPAEGWIERGFRNRGEAIKFLEHHYGRDWKRLRPRFENTPEIED